MSLSHYSTPKTLQGSTQYRLLLALAVATLFVSGFLQAQEVAPVTPLPVVAAHLVFTADQELDVEGGEGVFPLVELPLGESVLVKLTFPTPLAGEALGIETPDGGSVTLPEGDSKVISKTGVYTFSYTSGAQVGSYRVVAVHGEERWTLTFSAPNFAKPDQNPAALQPVIVETDAK